MFKDENRHYSLRKLSVGLASVLIGISFASTTGNSVKADTVNGDNNGVQTVVKGNDAAVETDAESASEGQSQTPEAIKKDFGAITQDIKQDAINTKAKQQNTTVQSSDRVDDEALKANNSSVVQEDNNTKGDSLTDKSNALKVKAKATKKAVAAAFYPDSSENTLNLKGAKFIDPEALRENKTEAAIKADPEHGVDPVKFAANGGFDPAIWGTMDISKWQLDNNGNITGYTGDMSNIIIPNSADFAKAGKNYQQISISSDEMKELLRSNGKDYPIYYDTDTLAISLTNDNKVKATNADWSNVFILSRLHQANLEELDTSTVTNMSYMFDESVDLTNLDVSNWNTSNVTNMSRMFSITLNLKSLDLSKWDTGKVTDMSGMFSSASSLTSLDVSKWDTGKVTDMSGMFSSTSNLTNLDVSNWDTGNVTNMSEMFKGDSSLKSLDVSKWDTGKVTDMSGMFSANMHNMFNGAISLKSLDVSNWDTGNVTNMSEMFNGASSLKSLDVSKWNTGKVTDMGWMFNGANNLKSLDVSKWDTSKVTNMGWMFNGANNLALIVNGDKFADYLVKNNFAYSGINSDVKSVTTDNDKLIELLTNDIGKSDSATRTIVFTFPANYSPDLAKYHLTKVGNTYQIKQSADYAKSYSQGTVLINATDDITKHHIDTTKQYKLSWQPNYNKLVLAHKNSDGTVSFDDIKLPQIPGYKTVASPVNPAMALFAVSFMALPKPVTPAINDAKPAKTVTPEAPAATEAAEPIKTEHKVAITPKAIDLSDDVVVTTPDVSTWQVANEPEQDTYRVSNGQYAVELPHISNTQLHVIADDSTKDSILFTYKGQNNKYVFKIKFANGHYLLTTYKIKSGKLVKLIDYNFVSSSKIINVISDWLKLK